MRNLAAATLIVSFVLACGDDDGKNNFADAATDAGGLLDGSITADGAPAVTCPSAETLSVLNEHIQQLGASSEMLAGHPGDREATGFFLFPGFDPGTVAIFAGPLIMACSEPMSYDEYCDETYCSQIECTGEGAGWIMHLRLPMPVTSGEYVFAEATIDNSWADGATGTDFSIAAAITGPGGLDYSFSGTGRMRDDGLEITEEYPLLVDGEPLTITVVDSEKGHIGDVKVGGQVVATVDANDAQFIPTTACQ